MAAASPTESSDHDLNRSRLAQLRQLRTRFWHEGLSLRLKPASRSELIRIVRGKAALGPTGQVEPTQLKQWKGFASGRRTPRKRLIQSADAAVGPNGSGQGSMADYNLVLWEVLAAQTAGQTQWPRLIARLDPSVRRIAAAAPCLMDARGGGDGIPALRPLELLRLRERPSFDCLALLCIVVFQAHRVHDEVLAQEAGQQLVNSFWQMALAFKTQGLAVDIFVYIERWVLPQAQRGALSISFGADVNRRIALLNYEASIRRTRMPRESLEQAAAKFVRSTAGMWTFSARAHQYRGIRHFVDGKEPTAGEVATVWFERAVAELLLMSSDPWGPVTARLWKLSVNLKRALSDGAAAPQDSVADHMDRFDSDTPSVSLELMRQLCPGAMTVRDRLLSARS
jgi:hypothetical protein